MQRGDLDCQWLNNVFPDEVRRLLTHWLQWQGGVCEGASYSWLALCKKVHTLCLQSGLGYLCRHMTQWKTNRITALANAWTTEEWVQLWSWSWFMWQLIFFCLLAYNFLCEPCNSSIQTRCETGGWLVKINFTNNLCHYSSGERSTDLKKKKVHHFYHRGKNDLEGGCKQLAKQKFFSDN